MPVLENGLISVTIMPIKGVFFMNNLIKILGSIVLLIILFSMSGCSEPSNNNSDNLSIIVIPNTATVAQGGQLQFNAIVKPEWHSQTVLWSIEPAFAGSIVDGLLIPTSYPGTQIIVKATAIGTNISGMATVTVGQPVTPTSIIISPSSVYIAKGKQQQFKATVGPEGSPQAVTWSVSPQGAGTITASGILTVTGAEIGDTLTITATAINHPTVSSFAIATVPEPISITVTGISSWYNGDDSRISLRSLDTGKEVAYSWSWINNTSVSFDLLERLSDYWDDEYGYSFASPGDYEIQLRIGDENFYYIGEINITQGANIIPLLSFTSIPPIVISITGIPSQYINSFAHIGLKKPGIVINNENSFNYDIIWNENDIQILGSSMTFLVNGAIQGNYNVILDFHDEYLGAIVSIYTTSSRNISVSNNIPFNQFTAMQPSLTITISGIPTEYHDSYGVIELYHSDTGNWVEFENGTIINDSSVIIHFWFVDPGNYRIYLNIISLDYDYLGEYVYSGTLNATTAIPWSAFTLGYMSVTVTEIPIEYNNCEIDIILFNPKNEHGIYAWGYIENSSITFKIWYYDFEPGEYDISLILNDNWQTRYILSSKYVYDGIRIPFNDFLVIHY